MPLTRQQIEKSAGKVIFARGEEYYNCGMVRSVSWEGQSVQADVQGSRRKPYKVIAAYAHGAPVARCTCPYDWGGLCKHGVAVFLYLLDHDDINAYSLSAATQDPAARAKPAGKKIRAAKVPREDKDRRLQDFLLSSCEAPRLQVGITLKGGRVFPEKGIPFQLAVLHQDRVHKITDLDSFLAADRHCLNDYLPAITAFSPGQEQLVRILRTFIRGADDHQSSSRWRLLAFQLSAFLEAASRETGVDIVDIKTAQPFVMTQEPPVGLKVTVKSVRSDAIEVRAFLVDKAVPDRVFQILDVIPGVRAWIFHDESQVFRPLDPRIDRRFLLYFLDGARVLTADDRRHFLVGVLPKLQTFAEVITDDPAAYTAQVEAPVSRPHYEVDADEGELAITLSFDYGVHRMLYFKRSAEMYLECATDAGRVLVRRDIAREDAIADALTRKCKSTFDNRSGRFIIGAADAIFDFVTLRVHELSREGTVLLTKQAQDLYQEEASIRPRVRVSGSGIDWFAYDISYSHLGEDVVIPEKVIREHMASGKRFVRLKSGAFVRLDIQAFERVSALLADRDRKGKLQLAHLPFIMDQLNTEGFDVEIDAETQKLYDELKNFRGITDAPVPPSLQGILRDYQRQGISWMAFLGKFRFGGILADDMGLGKTVQALAVILADIEAGCTLPSLIVCPTTLVWNWQAEVAKFLPGITPLVITGNARREQMEAIAGARIVITSYPLLRRDIDHYHKHQFHYLILDEAQNIKNRHTINARVVKQLNADRRLALTGTPLENSVADIWSILDFLMPSFLGDYERFRTAYEVPITQDQNLDKLKELSRRIAPFVLRRLKKDVIRELPEKIEQTSFCELGPAQAKAYAAMAEKARQEATAAYQKQGFDRSRMLILTLLLRLRQICCHPELAGIRLGHRMGVSAKTELFNEMLGELLSSGHRVLVFSQFVSMLKILREQCDRDKILYEYMDGQTRDRQERVEKFNNDPDVKVFLLSLKVGGLGLNLTSADTVILYDPWWNPAVEQQAIDRAHRIGQKNSVLAYHLIARGTIEEKILELQSRKKSLMGALVLSEETISKKLDWDDIRFLLGFDDKK